MATSFEQLRAEMAIVAPWLIPVISSCSSLGDTAYLIDTKLWQDVGGGRRSP